MKSVKVAGIGTAVFGVVSSLSFFIRQLFNSRDRTLNRGAEQRALAEEAKEMQNIRAEMAKNRRSEAHYHVLGANKEAIRYVDNKIADILNKKWVLIQRYGQIALKESYAVVDGCFTCDRRDVFDMLREEIDREICFYNKELFQLQERRSSLWDAREDLQASLLADERTKNARLDSLYHRYISMLEKLYARHNDHTDAAAIHALDAELDDHLVSESCQQLYPQGPASREQFEREKASRRDVRNVEKEMNGAGYKANRDERFEKDDEGIADKKSPAII